MKTRSNVTCSSQLYLIEMNSFTGLNVFLGVLLIAPGALSCFRKCPIVFPTYCPYVVDYCYSDYDCAYDFTCCSVQCGSDCIWDGYLTDSSYSKDCPASDSFDETCETLLDDCNSPGDCEEGQLCCMADTCGKRCVTLEPDSISKTSDTAGPDVGSKKGFFDALLYAAHLSLPSGSKLAQPGKMAKLMGEDWEEYVTKNNGRKPGWEERIKKQMEEQMSGE